MAKCSACGRSKRLSNWFVGDLLFTDLCSNCVEFGESGVPTLGLSIRRFVRVREVERLRSEVAMMLGPGPTAAMHDAFDALDRLAAMAMEVE